MKFATRRIFALAAIAALLFTALPAAIARAEVAYTPLVLTNFWAWYGGTTAVPSVGVDHHNIVHLKGAMSLTFGNKQEPFVLPSQFRPNRTVHVPVILRHAAIGQLSILPNGKVTVLSGGPITDAFQMTSLEGVAFSRN